MAPAAIDAMEVENPPGPEEKSMASRSTGQGPEGQKAAIGSALGKGTTAVLREHVQPLAVGSSPSTIRRQGVPSSQTAADGRLLVDESRLLSSTQSRSRSHEVKSPSESQKLASASPGPNPGHAQSAVPFSIKMDKEVARLKEVIEETSPAALHRVLRESWRQLLFLPYEEDHVSFILRACLKNSAINISDRILNEFFSVGSNRPAVIQRALEDATSEQVVDFVLPDILDQAVAERLKNAPAKDIVNWLAEAGRLGYSKDDILDEDDESVIPNVPSRPDSQNGNAVIGDGPLNRPYPATTLHRDPPLGEQEQNAKNQDIYGQMLILKRQQQDLQRQQKEAGENARAHPQPSPPPRAPETSSGNGPLSCPRCQYRFTTFNGYNYHMSKNVCTKYIKDGSKHLCTNCGQRFTTKQGMNYHLLKKVCEGDDDNAPSPSSQLQQEAAANQYNTRPPPPALNASNVVNSTGPTISRPAFSNAPRPTAAQAEQFRVPSQSQPQPQGDTKVQILRPPLHTPSAPAAYPAHYSSPAIRTKKDNLDIRQSPSELPAAKQDELNKQIREQEIRYAAQCSAVPMDIPLEEREKRLISLKNGNASRKSQIRKSFGVTLRMRAKDKLARNAAMASPSSSSIAHLESFRASNSTSVPASSSPAVTPHVPGPTSGFSPINAPHSTSTPPNMNGSRAQPTPSYAGRPSQPQANNALLHANQDRHNGFGMLRATNQPSQENHNTSQRPAKRQRMSEEKTNDAPYFIPTLKTGGPSMMIPVRSEDAASKYPKKKVPIGAAQAKWEALQPRNKSRALNVNSANATDEETPISEAPSATVSDDRPGSREKAISITSSSDGEIELLKSAGSGKEKDRPLPSTEMEHEEDRDTESDGDAPQQKVVAARSVGSIHTGFMARRGGRRP